MFSPELNVLIACASPPAEAKERITDAFAQPLDLPLLIGLADAQGMLPILARTLNQTGCAQLPSEFKTDILARTTAKAMRSLGMAGELVRIMRSFEATGITAITFKGPTLAYLAYGNLALRDSTDLDIYVPRNQITIARNLLMENGYGKKSPGSNIWLTGACEVALRRQNPDCEIDLHWEFSPPYFIPFDASRAADRSVVLQAPGLAVRTLCMEDLLLYLCIHGAREWWSIRLICDVAMLLRNCPLGWDDVMRESARSQCWRTLAIGLKLAADLFQSPVPTDIWCRVKRNRSACEIASYIVSRIRRKMHDYAGAPGGALLHLRMVEGTSSKARYLWRRAVQPNHLDADFFPLPQRWAAAYYVIRPVRVAGIALRCLRPR